MCAPKVPFALYVVVLCVFFPITAPWRLSGEKSEAANPNVARMQEILFD